MFAFLDSLATPGQFLAVHELTLEAAGQEEITLRADMIVGTVSQTDKEGKP